MIQVKYQIIKIYWKKKDLNINTNFISGETRKVPPSNNVSCGSPDDNQNETSFNGEPPHYSFVVTNDNLQSSEQNKPKPQPRTKFSPDDLSLNYPSAPSYSPNFSIPNLPSVPPEMPEVPSCIAKDDDEIDFDDLTRRFEELKKRK